MALFLKAAEAGEKVRILASPKRSVWGERRPGDLLFSIFSSDIELRGNQCDHPGRDKPVDVPESDDATASRYLSDPGFPTPWKGSRMIASTRSSAHFLPAIYVIICDSDCPIFRVRFQGFFE